MKCQNCKKEIEYYTSPRWQLCEDCTAKKLGIIASTQSDIILTREPESEDNIVIKADNGKPRLDLVPLEVLIPLAKIREYGLQKYGSAGAEGWKSVEKERYLAALLRHLVAYQKDNNALDKESGLPAIYHVLCNAAFLAIKHEEEINNKV